MLWGNLVTLNALRRAKGLNLITLRPHCGESGDPSHLAGAYLCAASINHGIRLSDSAVLQYLYYVDQVGLSISPSMRAHALGTNPGTLPVCCALVSFARAYTPFGG